VVRHFAELCVAASNAGRKMTKQVHKKFNIIPDAYCNFSIETLVNY
jgi:hypothetical protein